MRFFCILLSIGFLGICQAQESINYRQEMRDLVIGISDYAKKNDSLFAIIPQNGLALITEEGEPEDEVNMAYLNAIDAHGQESLFYGYNKDNKASPKEEAAYTSSLLDLSSQYGNVIMVTDYCSSEKKMISSYKKNAEKGYVSFAAPERGLTVIPKIGCNKIRSTKNISNLNEAQSFLYLINPANYKVKEQYLKALENTNYDILLIDLFFSDGNALQKQDVERLKLRTDGTKRLVVCYMSIGEAEDYRFYWKEEWFMNAPSWMGEENPNWEGNYKVRYWDPQWKNLVFGNSESYLDKILSAGFNGVYLDIIDGFEYFEEQ